MGIYSWNKFHQKNLNFTMQNTLYIVYTISVILSQSTRSISQSTNGSKPIFENTDL